MKLEDFKKQLQSTLGDKYIDGSKKINKCDMCDKLLTEGEHPNCCSDCWCANKEYYE